MRAHWATCVDPSGEPTTSPRVATLRGQAKGAASDHARFCPSAGLNHLAVPVRILFPLGSMQQRPECRLEEVTHRLEVATAPPPGGWRPAHGRLRRRSADGWWLLVRRPAVVATARRPAVPSAPGGFGAIPPPPGPPKKDGISGAMIALIVIVALIVLGGGAAPRACASARASKTKTTTTKPEPPRTDARSRAGQRRLDHCAEALREVPPARRAGAAEITKDKEWGIFKSPARDAVFAFRPSTSPVSRRCASARRPACSA